MAGEMTIEERLNLLFPGITKSSYSMGDVLPRRPRGVTPTQEQTAQRMFAGYAYDPRVRRNVPGDPYAMMDQLNQMAAKRSAVRIEMEDEEKRSAGLRSALESVYGPGVMKGIEGAPESVWPSLAGVRSRRAEAERAAGLDAEDARRRAEMYRKMVTDRYPELAPHLPPGLDESDILRVADWQRGVEREKEQESVQSKMQQAAQWARHYISKGDIATAQRILQTVGAAYMKGPDAIGVAQQQIADIQAEVEAEQQAQEKAQQEEQRAFEKQEQGAVKFATSMDGIVKKIRDISIKEPERIPESPETPFGGPGGPKEIGALARELGNLLQQARALAERSNIPGDVIQRVISNALSEAGGYGPGAEKRGEFFDALFMGESMPELPGGMTWEQTTGAEPFGDMSAADVQRAARLIAQALESFSSQYMGQARQRR